MAVYTQRFAALRIADVSWHSLYRAPDTGTVVVRDLMVINEDVTAIERIWVLINPATKTGQVTLWRTKVEAVSTVHLELRQVLEPREEVIISGSSPNYTILMTGYHLS